MSLLAAPRRKVRYNVNPNGNTWANDTDAYGKKMLEKMGWSKGKGLGANLDGMTTHIKVQHKSDQKGMGFKDRNDQWTEHENNFADLLKNLQSDGHQAMETEELKNREGRKSLELKSKASKARVHYKKFTRGKDLSRYSNKDLANIFGRKTLEKPVKTEETTKESQERPEGDGEERNSKSFGVETLQGGSMTDYFKKKMSQFKINFSTKIKPVENDYDEEDEERPSFGLGFGGGNSGGTFGLGFVPSSEDLTSKDDDVAETGKEENEVNKSEGKKRKRKLGYENVQDANCKKKKRVSGLENQGFEVNGREENCDSGVSLDDNPFEVKLKVKKCKKSKVKHEKAKENHGNFAEIVVKLGSHEGNGGKHGDFEENEEYLEESVEKPENEIFIDVSKKNKKLKLQTSTETDEVPEETISKKKKKKTERSERFNNLGLENPNFEDISITLQETQKTEENPLEIVPKKKKNKKDKRRHQKEKLSKENLEENIQKSDGETLEIEENDGKTLEYKKRHGKSMELATSEESVPQNQETEGIDIIIPKIASKKKKNKKSKPKQENEGLENPNFQDNSFQTPENKIYQGQQHLEETNVNCEERTSKKKKNKKNKSIREQESSFQDENDVQAQENGTHKDAIFNSLEITSKKKKQIMNGIENPNFEVNSPETCPLPAKNDFLEIHHGIETNENSFEITPRKKKNKKNKPLKDSQGIENPNFVVKSPETQEIPIELPKNEEGCLEIQREEVNPYEVTPKKKKNKTKLQKMDEGIENPNFEVNSMNNKENDHLEGTNKDGPLNLFDMIAKSKKNKKKRKHQEGGLHNPSFNPLDEMEVKRDVSEVNDVFNEDSCQKKKKSTSLTDTLTPDGVSGNTELDMETRIETTLQKTVSEEVSDETKKCLEAPKRTTNNQTSESTLENTIDMNIDLAIDNLILNITSIEPKPILSTPQSAQNGVKRRKSVRIDESLNQERIIPNTLQLKRMALERTRNIEVNSGIANPSFNPSSNDGDGFYDTSLEVKKASFQGISNPGYRNVQEEIEDAQKSLESCQAEAENDINEEKATQNLEGQGYRFIGTVSELDMNVRLENGNVKLAFKNSNLKTGFSYYDSSNASAKKGYRHLVKGDVELEFKGSNLETVLGYATVEKLNKLKQKALEEATKKAEEMAKQLAVPERHKTNLLFADLFAMKTKNKLNRLARERGLKC